MVMLYGVLATRYETVPTNKVPPFVDTVLRKPLEITTSPCALRGLEGIVSKD